MSTNENFNYSRISSSLHLSDFRCFSATSQFCGIQIYNSIADAHIFRLQVSKRSPEHTGHCQLFLLLYSPDKINLRICFVLDTKSVSLPFSSLKQIQGSRYFKKKETPFFPASSFLTNLKQNCQNYIALNISPLKEKVKVENNGRTNVHHIIDALLKARQILQWQVT